MKFKDIAAFEKKQAGRRIRIVPILESLEKARKLVNDSSARVELLCFPLVGARVSNNGEKKELSYAEFVDLMRSIRIGSISVDVDGEGIVESYKYASTFPIRFLQSGDIREQLENILVGIEVWKEFTGNHFGRIGREEDIKLEEKFEKAKAIGAKVDDLEQEYRERVEAIKSNFRIAMELVSVHFIIQMCSKALNDQILFELREPGLMEWAAPIIALKNKRWDIDEKIEELEKLRETSAGLKGKKGKETERARIRKKIRELIAELEGLRQSREKRRKEQLEVTLPQTFRLLREQVNGPVTKEDLEYSAYSIVTCTKDVGKFKVVRNGSEIELVFPLEPRKRTKIEEEAFLERNLPGLCRIIEQEIAKENEQKEGIRKIRKQLVELGVPPVFFSPRLKEMEEITDPEKAVEKIYDAYERTIKVIPMQPKAERGPVSKKLARKENGKKRETEESPDASAIRIIDTLILSQFEGSVNKMGSEQKQLIERNISQIRRFVLEYLLYLESPVGERGVFAEGGSIEGSNFRERFKMNTKNEGWRHFALQDADSRIVISVRPENREIMLTTVEVNHDRYVEQLARFDARSVKGAIQIIS